MLIDGQPLPPLIYPVVSRTSQPSIKRRSKATKAQSSSSSTEDAPGDEDDASNNQTTNSEMILSIYKMSNDVTNITDQGSANMSHQKLIAPKILEF